MTKWSNTLKQFVGKLPTNCLSVSDHFVKLALKGLSFFNLLCYYHIPFISYLPATQPMLDNCLGNNLADPTIIIKFLFKVHPEGHQNACCMSQSQAKTPIGFELVALPFKCNNITQWDTFLTRKYLISISFCKNFTINALQYTLRTLWQHNMNTFIQK